MYTISSSVTRPRRLLIVGDVALSRSLMHMVLSRLGYDVTCLANGQEALTALGHTRYDLTLIALHLPDLPGLALARRLRDTPGRVAAMPILLFGDAWDPDQIVDACQELELQGYLPKPISIGKLVSSVCDLVYRAAPSSGVSTSMPRPTPMTIERLLQFTDGDEQLERELASLYLSTASLYVEEMRGLLTNEAEWRRTAHALKGASANIGAVEVARLAADAEQAPPTPERLGELEDALDDVRTFFRERSTAWPMRPETALATSR